MICNNCGREVAPDDNYCIYCGTIAKYRTDEVKKTKAVKENNSQLISHKTNLKSFLYVALVFCLIFGVYKMSDSEKDSIYKRTTKSEQEHIQNKKSTTRDSQQKEFLSESERIKKETEKRSFGTAGRLYSEDLNISVPLYYCDMLIDNNNPSAGKNPQIIVDNPDSAAWLDYHLNTTCITDHSGDGFYKIKRSIPHETVIYRVLENGNLIQKYTCEYTCNGKNTGTGLIKEDGTDAIFSDPGGLVLYTCNDDSGNVFIAHYLLTGSFVNR